MSHGCSSSSSRGNLLRNWTSHAHTHQQQPLLNTQEIVQHTDALLSCILVLGEPLPNSNR